MREFFIQQNEQSSYQVGKRGLFMQAIVETLFDAVYLTSVIAIGVTMIVKSRGNKEYWLFGIMAVVLGAGDAFHLVTRALALCATGLENFIVPLGIGKFITSITMTIFYIILYYVWRVRYKVNGQNGITHLQIPNDELSWEKSKNFNVGIDFGIFGCLNGSIEYYNKTSDALLLEKPLAPSTGFENAISNLGGMRNQGIEIDLHSTNINTKDFTWTTDFNIAFNNNTIAFIAADDNNYLLKFNRKGDLIKIYETDRRFLCMAITPDDHDLYTVILNDKQEAIIARTNLD